ncbi:MAG: hypothetical protein OHK0012_06290 [Synechococcales cyanobacterium]
MSKLEAHRDFLLEMVASYPDWTLIQYAEYLHNQRGIEASPSILCQFFQRERITLKKDLSGHECGHRGNPNPAPQLLAKGKIYRHQKSDIH